MEKTTNIPLIEKKRRAAAAFKKAGVNEDVQGLSEAALDSILGLRPTGPKKGLGGAVEAPKRATYEIAPATKFRTDAEIREWEWKTQTFPLIQASKIPSRYHGEIRTKAQWDCEPQFLTYRACQRKFSGTGSIVVLVGERGTGKTTIAGQLIIGESWAGRLAPYRKLTEVVSFFKAIYADFGTVEEEFLTWRRDEFCKRKLAVIDEIHEATEDSRHALKILTDILDRRYSNRVDTLMISNQTEEQFRASVNDSILSRIMEHGRIIPCVWPSWRERIAAKEAAV